MLNDIELKDVCPIVFKVEVICPHDVKAWVYMVIQNDYDDASKPLEVRSYVTKVFISEDDARLWLYREYKRWQGKFKDSTGIVMVDSIGIQHQSGSRVTMYIKKVPVW